MVLLMTNQFHKDLQSANPLEVGLALGSLASMATPALAQDVVPDVLALLSSSRPGVRKRAVLCCYQLFLRFPAALKPSWATFVRKLQDEEPTVVAAAVNVVCELAAKNPRNYLTLAPLLYAQLTRAVAGGGSSNAMASNWMLTKIVKLFGSLAPEEPRLSRKLAEPLANLINTTSSKSLLYECINTVIVGLTDQVRSSLSLAPHSC